LPGTWITGKKNTSPIYLTPLVKGVNSLLDTKTSIDWIVKTLRKDQTSDGSWNYPFDTGISTDAYMIILLRALKIHDEELIQGLSKRILSKQEQNGAWKLFYDEGEGNITATVEAYYALLASGYYSKDDKSLKAAKRFIITYGGLNKVSIFTKIMLALTGQLKWPSRSPLPIEVILLPRFLPVHFYSFSSFGRANLTPIMILSAKKFTLSLEGSPNLSDLKQHRDEDNQWNYSREWRSLLYIIEEGIKRLIGVPGELRNFAIDKAKNYMLGRIEADGTFLSYFSSTFLMIFALLSVGYKRTDPVIMKAIDGLKAMKCEINSLPHMQYTTANVWNTALISTALQSAGITADDPMIKESNRYLLSRQHHKYGDWIIQNSNSLPGGWGFSDVNSIHPDVDDTTASLRSIVKIARTEKAAWDRGVSWTLSMQNDDGGWPAFERNTDSMLLKLLPFEKGEFLLLDPSSADLTGRTLEFLGNYTTLSKNHPLIKKAIGWLWKDQRKDGSWYGRWGICYTYGTWAAITGLRAVGVSNSDPHIQKAASWFTLIQNPDGGWGESCHSDIKQKYIPLGSSTLTHTAWALDALISLSDKPTKEIEKGMAYLTNSLKNNDWTTHYPKGQGMGGAFYIHYHGYRYIFPLITLAHYQKKYG